MANNTYYSDYKGEQIDSAFEAIQGITTPSTGSYVVVVTNETGAKGGPILKRAEVLIDKVGKAAEASETNIGNFVITSNSSGDIKVSSVNMNSFLKALNSGSTVGNLVKIDNDGTGGFKLIDAGLSAEDISESVSIVERFAQDFEDFKAEVREEFDDVNAGLETATDLAISASFDVADMKQTGVAYTEVDGPEFDEDDGDIGFSENGGETQYPLFYVLSRSESISYDQVVTRYGGARDPNLIYAELHNFDNIKMIDSGSISKPEKDTWHDIKNHFPLWTKNGDLKDSGVSYEQYLEMVTDIEIMKSVIEKLKAQGIIYLNSDGEVQSPVSAFIGDVDQGLVSAYDELAHTTTSVTGYVSRLVQLYTFDGGTAIYPRA